MPELPDVEYFRRYLNATALHRPITGIEVGDTRILSGTSARRLRRRLLGRRLEGSRRHGKYLFAATDGAVALVLHFGMTGYLRYFKRPRPPPRHCRMMFTLDDHRLAYVSQRMLGTVGLTGDIDGFIEAHGLGPDALQLDRPALAQIIQARRGGIKALLMNQHVIAGLGNVYSDEVLFQAGIRPRRALRRLSAHEVARLHDRMREVLRHAAHIVADPRRLPHDWLLGHRRRGARCPRCGAALRRVPAAGRTSYYCARCQR